MAPPEIPEGLGEFSPSLDIDEVVVVANVVQTSHAAQNGHAWPYQMTGTRMSC